MTRIRRTGIIQVAQQTRLARCATAIEGSHTIYTSGAVETGGCHTIVYIVAAISTFPAVDADAGIIAVGIGASRAILTNRRSHRALIHIFFTQFAGKVWRAGTTVCINAIYASTAVLA